MFFFKKKNYSYPDKILEEYRNDCNSKSRKLSRLSRSSHNVVPDEGKLITIFVNSHLIMTPPKNISKLEHFNSSFGNVCSGKKSKM